MRKAVIHAALILLAAVSSIHCGGATTDGGARHPAGHARASHRPAGDAHGHRPAPGRPAMQAPDEELRAVAAIHGAAGPWRPASRPRIAAGRPGRP
ncbi:hypothetical protein WME75_29740 [Sorangium sp. So ce1014]|uniref:hypothetical protein n=1 Tax=Sorangium sp. So ce1014 TaxID=3133326 RepID=UPI003F5F0437